MINTHKGTRLNCVGNTPSHLQTAVLAGAKTPQMGQFANGIVQNSHMNVTLARKGNPPPFQMGFDSKITIAREPCRPLKLSSLKSEKMTTGFVCMRKILFSCMKATVAQTSSGRQPLIMSDMCSSLHICFTSSNME